MFYNWNLKLKKIKMARFTIGNRIFPFSGKVRLSATRLPTWLDLLPGSASSGEVTYPQINGDAIAANRTIANVSDSSSAGSVIASDNNLSSVANGNTTFSLTDKAAASNGINENAPSTNENTGPEAFGSLASTAEEKDDRLRKERVL
jgi:hypothetical protein